MPQIPVQRIAEINTLNDARVPTDDTGTDAELLSELAYKIRNIQGTDDWFDAPAKSLAELFQWITTTNVLLATTGNITLSGIQTIDGVTPSVFDWVLVKNQSTNTQNGIYQVSSGAWTRVAEYDASNDPPFRGFTVFVIAGTANQRTMWMQTAAVPNLGAQVWQQIGGGGGSVVDASDASKGITRLSLAPVSAPAPIAVGDNDPRLTNLATTGAIGHVRISTTPSSGDPVAVTTNSLRFETLLDGLKPVWVSNTAVTLQTGVAWAPGINDVINVPSNIAKTGLSSLTANTWYYLYLFSNSGTPDLDISTTAPAAPYKGNARVKGGPVNTHRLVGAIRTNASGQIYKWRKTGDFVAWLENLEAAPFEVINDGQATSETNVSCAAAVPTHTQLATIQLEHFSSSVSLRVGTPDDNFTLSTTAYISKVYGSASNWGEQVTNPVALDSSQQFSYLFPSDPGSSGFGFYARVMGYHEEL